MLPRLRYSECGLGADAAGFAATTGAALLRLMLLFRFAFASLAVSDFSAPVVGSTVASATAGVVAAAAGADADVAAAVEVKIVPTEGVAAAAVPANLASITSEFLVGKVLSLSVATEGAEVACADSTVAARDEEEEDEEEDIDEGCAVARVDARSSAASPRIGAAVGAAAATATPDAEAEASTITGAGAGAGAGTAAGAAGAGAGAGAAGAAGAAVVEVSAVASTPVAEILGAPAIAPLPGVPAPAPTPAPAAVVVAAAFAAFAFAAAAVPLSGAVLLPRVMLAQVRASCPNWRKA